MKAKRILSLLAIAILALACASGAHAEDGVSIKKRTLDMASRNLFNAIAKNQDAPLVSVNSTINSPDLSYNSWTKNSTGDNVSQHIPYSIDGKTYGTNNGTVDLSGVNTWTTMGNNTVCKVVAYIDANGQVNATQGTVYPATTAGNATCASDGWPETPHGVAILGGLLLYSPPTSQLTIGTTALVQGTNAWVQNMIRNPRYGLKE